MRPRPQISIACSLDPEAALERFRVALEDPDAMCTGFVGKQEVTLRIHAERRRRWSPWLQLRITADETGTLASGTMGPAAELWTAFVFCYAALVAAFTAGVMYGSVQLSMGDSPTGLAAAGAALFGLAAACGLDLFGRRLGEGQMGLIRGFVALTLDAEDRTSPSGNEARSG